jgi:hypothetical protein
MHDLWGGKYIVLSSSGYPLGLGPTGFFEAYNPSDVYYWDEIELAQQAIKRLVEAGSGYTVHRIERLVVLQEKFSY